MAALLSKDQEYPEYTQFFLLIWVNLEKSPADYLRKITTRICVILAMENPLRDR